MTLDPKFAAGMREQLIETAAGTSPLAIRIRRHKLAVRVLAGAAAIGLLTAGAVIAVSAIPGGHVITSVGEPISQSHVGSATVELGARPETANAVSYVLTCTSAGMIEVQTAVNETAFAICGPDGATDPRDPSGSTVAPLGTTMTVRDQLLADGATSFEVTADPGTSWSVSAGYVHTETTDWGVNANGQTFGAPNENGLPDLTPAQATNCRVGWVFTTDMFAQGPADSPDHYTVPVYEADGTTQIGEFPFWNNLDLPDCPK